MVEPETDLDQHLAGRDAPSTPARRLHVEPDLLVARATKSLGLGTFPDRPADLRGAVWPACEAVDLLDELPRNARGEVADESQGAGETAPRVSRLHAETVS
jgi:hypothetical protein